MTKLSASDFFNHVTVDKWSPAQTPEDWRKVEFSTDGRISEVGTYEVVFLYQKGGQRAVKNPRGNFFTTEA